MFSQHCLRAVLLAAATLLLAGCGAKLVQPTGKDLALVTASADAGLNAPVADAYKALTSGSKDGKLYPRELQINAPTEVLPVDWWLWQHGFLKIGGIEGYVAWMALTPEGQAAVQKPAPKILATTFQGPPEVSCSKSGATSVCSVSGKLVVHPLDGAASEIRGPMPALFGVEAQMHAVNGQWTLDEVRLAPGVNLYNLGVVAVFGDREHFFAARNAWAAKVNKLVG